MTRNVRETTDGRRLTNQLGANGTGGQVLTTVVCMIDDSSPVPSSWMPRVYRALDGEVSE